MTQEQQCPVVAYEYAWGPVPVGSNFRKLDELQRQYGPFFRSEEADGFWVATDYSVIREALQKPELFSNSIIIPIEPNPPVKWIPMMIDPPEHTKWRHLLSGYFTPGRVKKLEAEQRSYAIDLIEKLRPRGECDFYSDFAAVYPTTIFLQIMGLPTDKLDDFMVWEEKILHTTAERDPDRSIAGVAMMEVMGYFAGLIEEKRNDPSTRGDDIVSHAIDWRIDGNAPNDGDLLSCMFLLFIAGLDTVASTLSYTFHHLATHPDDRHKLVNDPARIPQAIEEFVRAFSIVQTARVATMDTDFHGCPIKKGDIVALPLGMANRDPKEHSRGGTVDLDAKAPRHIGFGAGPHRCLGAHLARQEMTVVLEEWHRRIPDYEVADQSGTVEHGGPVYGVERLPLRWNI